MIRLKELRNKNKLSQQKLADILGVSRSTVAMWETKSSQPDNTMLLSIANYFEVSTDYLLDNNFSTVATPKNLDVDTLNARDKKDIAKDLKSIREKLINKEDGFVGFDGENISEDDTELLLDALEMMLKRVKKINKEKYNPNKNKK